MIESDYQLQINPVGSSQSAKPATLASAATVAPTTFLTFVTGTTAIATVTAPFPDAHHELVFIFTTTTPTAFTTTGNIKAVATPTQNVPCRLIYDPIEKKYYAKS